MNTYYNPEDLAKFATMGEGAPQLKFRGNEKTTRKLRNIMRK